MTTPAQRPAPRAVFDTNVVISALLFTRGAAGRLRHAWQGGLVLPLVSTATAQELMRVLAYPKFKLTAQAQQELLADYLPWAQVVAVPSPPPRVPECRDVHDLPFLHLAVAGGADVLVTGDEGLLVLATAVDLTPGEPGAEPGAEPVRFGCRIQTLQTFSRALEA